MFSLRCNGIPSDAKTGKVAKQNERMELFTKFGQWAIIPFQHHSTLVGIKHKVESESTERGLVRFILDSSHFSFAADQIQCTMWLVNYYKSWKTVNNLALAHPASTASDNWTVGAAVDSSTRFYYKTSFERISPRAHSLHVHASPYRHLHTRI